MPIDINALRPERGGDPEKWREYCRKRYKSPELVDTVIELDKQWRKAQYDIEQLKKDLGVQQKKVSELKKSGAHAEADEIIKAMGTIRADIPEKEKEAETLKDRLFNELNKIPNIVDPSVPVSKDETNNAVVAQWGDCTTKPDLLHHHEILAMIDGYEPERGVAVAGHRGYFLKGVGLLLNQALINYGLTFLMNREYTPLQPPYFMNKEAMAGIAQLEDFDEQLYKVVAGEDDEKYLIATSEQPICVFHRNEWLAEKELPKKYAGYSSCFRKEAGSHGRDAWGIFRVHQFEKIEQFVVCEPEKSPEMHKEMIASAEDFYKSLNIPYRVVNIVSGELNNAAAIKYDLEGWFPTLARYRELVSCSNCTDYQARAMEVRCGSKKKDDREKVYCHFLNSTLCATTRTICAILENYQQADGVRVPDVLVPFMGGRTFLPFVKERPPPPKIDAKANATTTTNTAASSSSTTGSVHPPVSVSLPKDSTVSPSISSASSSSSASAKSGGITLPSPYNDLSTLNQYLEHQTYLSHPAYPTQHDYRLYTLLQSQGIDDKSPVLWTNPLTAISLPPNSSSSSASSGSSAPLPYKYLPPSTSVPPSVPYYTHIYRWFKHIQTYSKTEQEGWPEK